MKKLIMMVIFSGVVLGCSQNSFATLTDDGNIIAEGGYADYEKSFQLQLKNAFLKHDLLLVKQLLEDRLPIIFEIDEQDTIEKEKTIADIYGRINHLCLLIIDWTEISDRSFVFKELCINLIIKKLINEYGNSPWLMANLEKFVIHTKKMFSKIANLTIKHYDDDGSEEKYANYLNKLRTAIEKNNISSINQLLSNVPLFGAHWILNIDHSLIDDEKETMHFIYSEIEDWYEEIKEFTKLTETKNHISYELYVSAIITKLIDRYGNSPWFISNLEEFITHTKNVVAQATNPEQDSSTNQPSFSNQKE